MKNYRGLQPVATIAKAHEQNAARQMGDMLRQVEAQQLQLETLMSYRDDYLKNYSSASRTGLSAAQLRDYQVFIQRLDSAIVQQREQVVQSRHECEQSRAYWQSKHHHSEMISKVVDTRNQQEINFKNSCEQREQDDRSAIAYANAQQNMAK